MATRSGCGMGGGSRTVQEQFGGAARAYVESEGHARGADLERIEAIVAARGPFGVALDVATGGGHTARIVAPHARRVIASDLTEQMVATATRALKQRNAANVMPLLAAAEALPLADGSVDLVTCRIAPHHFESPGHFVAESYRVLRPLGLFVLEDSSVPRSDAAAEWLNRIERRRDSTHRRTLAVSEWRRLVLGAGFEIAGFDLFPKRHELGPWLARSRTPEVDRAWVHAAMRAAAPAIRAAFRLEFNDAGEPIAFTDFKLLIWATRPDHAEA